MTTALTTEQKAVKARIDQLAPLRAIVENPAYAELLEGLRAQRVTFIDDSSLYAHVNGLVEIMPRLKQALDSQPTEVPAAAPVAPPPPAPADE